MSEPFEMNTQHLKHNMEFLVVVVAFLVNIFVKHSTGCSQLGRLKMLHYNGTQTSHLYVGSSMKTDSEIARNNQSTNRSGITSPQVV